MSRSIYGSTHYIASVQLIDFLPWQISWFSIGEDLWLIWWCRTKL